MSSTLAASQLRRIDSLWARYEETNDERWMTAALQAERLYRRLVEVQS